MLLDVIAEWSGILSEPYAAARMNQMKAASRRRISRGAVQPLRSLEVISRLITAYKGRIWSLNMPRRGMSRVITFTPCTVIRPTTTEGRY